jgi:hypothetical protein
MSALFIPILITDLCFPSPNFGRPRKAQTLSKPPNAGDEMTALRLI